MTTPLSQRRFDSIGRFAHIATVSVLQAVWSCAKRMNGRNHNREFEVNRSPRPIPRRQCTHQHTPSHWYHISMCTDLVVCTCLNSLAITATAVHVLSKSLHVRVRFFWRARTAAASLRMWNWGYKSYYHGQACKECLYPCFWWMLYCPSRCHHQVAYMCTRVCQDVGPLNLFSTNDFFNTWQHRRSSFTAGSRTFPPAVPAQQQRTYT